MSESVSSTSKRATVGRNEVLKPHQSVSELTLQVFQDLLLRVPIYKHCVLTVQLGLNACLFIIVIILTILRKRSLGASFFFFLTS